MTASYFDTKDYENKTDSTLGENKPNSKPIPSEAKMSATVCFTRNYDDLAVLRLRKNKPNSKPNKPNFQKAQNERKLCFNKPLQESAPWETSAKQTQSNPMSKQPQVQGAEQECGSQMELSSIL